jgi:hypothetical protein
LLKTYLNEKVNLYINAKRGASISDKIVEIADHLPKKQAIYKLQQKASPFRAGRRSELMILKALRVAYCNDKSAGRQ